jgi:Effector-associated domain 1/Trypsin-like peptidase domain
MLNLTGQQLQQLSEALRDAFTRPRLAQALRFRLDKNLDDISLGADLQQIVFELIQTAQAEGWTDRLILAARESNPGNAKLVAFSQNLGLAATNVAGPELERLILASNSSFDVMRWRSQLGRIETQVCRIEIAVAQGTVYGTGFLVGSDLVLTNYHVMDSLIAEDQSNAAGRLQAKPSDVVLRFDYKRLADGSTLNAGTVYRLATSDWLVDRSPMSPADSEPDPKTETPRNDELDYALIRLDRPAGSDPVGGQGEPDSHRGWLKMPTTKYEFQPDTPLFIMQHPQGAPLKLALDTEGIIGTNQNGTRVLYRTNTLAGSSGSPCFDQNWNLVALHHSGDPNFDPAHKPAYNEGIPAFAIYQLLEQRGVTGALAENEPVATPST